MKKAMKKAKSARHLLQCDESDKEDIHIQLPSFYWLKIVSYKRNTVRNSRFSFFAMFMEPVTGQQMCTTVYGARIFLYKYREELEAIDKKYLYLTGFY